MTNLTAIIAEIEPYSLSDESVEKSFMDSIIHFGMIASVDDTYTSEMKQSVAYAAMLCLNRLRVLSEENIGGISQNYNVAKLEQRIKAIAKNAGLSSDLVLADDSEAKITYKSVW